MIFFTSYVKFPKGSFHLNGYSKVLNVKSLAATSAAGMARRDAVKHRPSTDPLDETAAELCSRPQNTCVVHI